MFEFGWNKNWPLIFNYSKKFPSLYELRQFQTGWRVCLLLASLVANKTKEHSDLKARFRENTSSSSNSKQMATELCFLSPPKLVVLSTPTIKKRNFRSSTQSFSKTRCRSNSNSFLSVSKNVVRRSFRVSCQLDMEVAVQVGQDRLLKVFSFLFFSFFLFIFFEFFWGNYYNWLLFV